MALNKKWLQSEKTLIQLKFKREGLGILYDYYLDPQGDMSATTYKSELWIPVIAN